MKIIISPAKKMVVDDIIGIESSPLYLEEASFIVETLKGKSKDELQKIWKTNDKLTDENFNRIKAMDVYKPKVAAISSYEGLQYKHMGAKVMTEDQVAYLQYSLRVISGIYGVLKPFDGISPYRLEMQAKFNIGEYNNLYDFWGHKIADAILSETKEGEILLILASKEYSTVVLKHCNDDINILTCIFGQMLNGKIKEKGTLCKMARGEMVRFLCESKGEKRADIEKFNSLGFQYREEFSSEDTLVFIKKD